MAIADVLVIAAPATLEPGEVDAPFYAELSAAGGTAPYTYSTPSPLPAGLSLTPDGILSGVPTLTGYFPFTVEVTDSASSPGPYHGARGYVLIIRPKAESLSISVNSGSSDNVVPVAVSEGEVDRVDVTEPEHGTAVAAGKTVTYTAARGFAGTDRFAYTATGPGGTSDPATVTVTVTPIAVTLTPRRPARRPSRLGLRPDGRRERRHRAL
ncbi:MAG: putative Ig domain-containing protein [Sphingomonas sp.]